MGTLIRTFFKNPFYYYNLNMQQKSHTDRNYNIIRSGLHYNVHFVRPCPQTVSLINSCEGTEIGQTQHVLMQSFWIHIQHTDQWNLLLYQELFVYFREKMFLVHCHQEQLLLMNLLNCLELCFHLWLRNTAASYQLILLSAYGRQSLQDNKLYRQTY